MCLEKSRGGFNKSVLNCIIILRKKEEESKKIYINTKIPELYSATLRLALWNVVYIATVLSGLFHFAHVDKCLDFWQIFNHSLQTFKAEDKAKNIWAVAGVHIRKKNHRSLYNISVISQKHQWDWMEGKWNILLTNVYIRVSEDISTMSQSQMRLDLSSLHQKSIFLKILKEKTTVFPCS